MSNFIDSWTWEIKDDSSGFKLIRPGIYPAKIIGFEQAEHLGSAKIPPCPKAILTLLVDTGEEPQEVKTNLLVHRKMEWKLSEFLRAIGRKKQGEALQMDWSNLVGQRLVVKISNRSYIGSDGDTHYANNIDRFCDFDPAMFPDDPDWLKEAQAAEDEEEIPF